MNLHLILFFLIRLALAVNLPDSKPPLPQQQQLVRKCNTIGDCDQVPRPPNNLQETIKSVKPLEPGKAEKPPGDQVAKDSQPPKKKHSQRKRTNLGVRDIRGDAKLNSFILKLNRELYEKVRKPPVDQGDQINRLKIAKDQVHDQLHDQLHDQQHSNEHNAQHHQLPKQTNEYDLHGVKLEPDELSNYLKEQRVKELQRQAFDSLQQIFEIDLPANPTFNQKFIELITALLSELRHIKSRLWQANCKMRLSFTNQQIFSDCETNHEEPCNCPKSAAIGPPPEEVDDKDEESNEHYQAVSADKRSIKPNSIEQEPSIENIGVASSAAEKQEKPLPVESSGKPKSSELGKLSAPANHQQNQTAVGQFNAGQSEPKKKAASKPAPMEPSKSSSALITPAGKSSIENKSKKETELSKQLRSAIDCFLCKHQWTNCLNYGIKCPAE